MHEAVSHAEELCSFVKVYSPCDHFINILSSPSALEVIASSPKWMLLCVEQESEERSMFEGTF